jgi:hypothetical protein
MNIRQLHKIILLILLLSFLFYGTTFTQFGNHKFPKPIKRTEFSDEIYIKSIVYQIEQSIKEQDLNKFERYLMNNIEDSTGIVRGKNDAVEKFNNFVTDIQLSQRFGYSRRRTPKLTNIKSTWDFEIDIKEIKISMNKNSAVVKCEIYFAMDQPDDVPKIRYAKDPKKIKEKLTLAQYDGKWKIQKVNKLFKFLEQRKQSLDYINSD